uniref:FK506-binding protein 5-like n=1 Tax=Paramormyrops kingsleyae TaxID=1676925 RepID=A0A3B3RWC8_9TELE|nr:FK506-binding protein 5-like [Paramormyrops kingsleyae]XP_023691966.1 FK506-binding protein 5-like [Paramormyrops kingsleyae]
MKPDGVATAAMEPMDAREGAGPVCEEPAAPPEVKKSAGEGKPPGDKTKSAKSGDTKAKAKGPTRAKGPTNVVTSTKASVTSPRPSPAPNRVLNGIQKQPASNGVLKKTAPPAPEKKKLAPAPAPTKKSVSPTKPAEKKPAAARPTSAPGAAGTPSPKKKAAAVTSNDAKAKPKTAAPRPTSAAPAKSSTGAKPDKPAVSMATRPAAGPPPRPAPAASAGKLASSSARPGPVKTSVPSAGKASTTQSPKPPTPAKKDVSRSTSTVAKKPTESPGRPSAAKTSKSESPKPVSASKSDAPNKRPVSSTKPADSKPTRPKPQEVKASTSPRPAGSKPGVGKSASPKKAVGSSTPMPVKRAPKPTPPVSAAEEQAEENLLQKASAASVSDTAATASQAPTAEPNVGRALQMEEAVELLPQAADLAQEETKVANVSTPRMEDSQDLVVLSEPEVAPLAQSPPSSTPAPLSLQAQSASPVVEPVIAHDDTSSKDQPPMTTAEDSVEYEPKIQPHVESTPQVSASIDQLAMISPIGETEVAVEKADEEINVDNDEDEEYEEKDDEDEKHKKKECGIQLSDMSMPQTMENFLKSDDLDLDAKDINGHQEELMKDPSVFLEETATLDDQEEVSLMGKDSESTGDTTYNSRITQHTCVMQLEKEDGEQEEEEEEDEEEEKQWEEKEQQEKQQEEEEQEEDEEEKHQSEEEQEKEQQQVEEKKEEKHQSEEEQEKEQQQVEEKKEEKQRVEQEVEFSLQLPEVCSSLPMEKFPAETNCSGFQGPMRTDLELDADDVHDDDGEDDDSNDDEDDDYVKGSQQEVQHHSTFDLLETTERTLSSMEARVMGKECEIFDAPSHHSELLPDITVEKRREEEENDTQELERKSQPIAEYLTEFTNLTSCTAVQGLSNPVIDGTNVNDHVTQILSTPDLLGALERTSNQEKASLMEMEDKLIDTLSQHNDSTPQIPLMEEEETEEAQFSLQMSEMSSSWQMEEFPAKSVDLISCVSSQSPSTVDMGNEDLSKSHVKTLEQDIAILPEDVDGACILGETNLKEEEGAVVCSVAHRYNSLQETPEKHEHEEEEDDDDDDEEEEEEEEEADQQDDMDVGCERAEDRRGVPHEDEEEDEDVEMASEVVTEGGVESYENVVEDDHAEGEHCLYNLNLTPSLPPVSSGPWDQLPLIAASQPLDQSLEPVLPAQPAWLDLGDTLRKEEPLLQASDKSPLDEVSRPVMPGCQPSAQQVAHCSSGSETGTPEELADYDSSSGVESRSEDKQRTPVPPAQPDIEQDLGIHLEKGDVEGEEEEAETLPADEVMGDPPTAHTSAPSSQSSSGDEASDNEGEIHINDPSSHIIDNANLDGKDQPALDESGEEDGGTPQSAASVPSYAFDCPTSNAHSTAESCGKSPGLFSLENEEQLLEDAKDPCLVQELTMSAATGHIDDQLGSPVALLPLRHHEENDKEEEDEEEEEVDPDEEQYLLRGKSDIGFPGILSSTGLLEADGHLSPHHHHTSGEDSESQPPYFTAICDKTDNVLAGNV